MVETFDIGFLHMKSLRPGVRCTPKAHLRSDSLCCRFSEQPQWRVATVWGSSSTYIISM